MKRVPLANNPITQHGSHGARVAHLLNKTSHSSIVRIQIEPDGVLGMHPAIEDQLFIVVQGNGLALSKDVDPIEIVEGDVVFWQGGEFHETRSGGDGLTAIVVEGPALGTAIRRKGERDA